jgi:hypothetical protein
MFTKGSIDDMEIEPDEDDDQVGYQYDKYKSGEDE